MLKLVGNCAFIVVLTVLTMLSSCLKRPEKRAPRLDSRSDSQPAVPASDCASLDPAARALHTKCRLDTDPLVTPERRKTTTEPTITKVSPDEEVEEEEEVEEVEEETPELDNNRPLANISVSASCDSDSWGCLYQRGVERYWLKCEIKAGGCKNGFAVEVETSGSPQVTRGSVCRDGDKTVADLSQGKIKLECKTDREVMFSVAPKKAELILRKSHLADGHVCVITDAGKSNVLDFSQGSFRIAAGACVVNRRTQFRMQLEFNW